MSEARREHIVDLSNVLVRSSEGLDCFAWLQGLPVLERIIRCKDCKHGLKGGMLCHLFASYAPIAGGDEYEEAPADVEPDGFCAWAERREA